MAQALGLNPGSLELNRHEPAELNLITPVSSPDKDNSSSRYNPKP